MTGVILEIFKRLYLDIRHYVKFLFMNTHLAYIFYYENMK